MSQIKIVSTDKAPAAIGPYSQAVVANGLVYCSGQIAFIPETMEVIDGDVGEHTAAGSSLERVLKTTVFLKDMNDFAVVNKVYAEFFSKHQPARATVQVARLPKDAPVEIECVALAL